jgi:hypothetical protein
MKYGNFVRSFYFSINHTSAASNYFKGRNGTVGRKILRSIRK